MRLYDYFRKNRLAGACNAGFSARLYGCTIILRFCVIAFSAQRIIVIDVLLYSCDLKIIVQPYNLLAKTALATPATLVLGCTMI